VRGRERTSVCGKKRRRDKIGEECTCGEMEDW